MVAARQREARLSLITRVAGHIEIWATLKIAERLLADSEMTMAQSILDAAAIIVPTGDLKNGACDKDGNLYHMQEHIVSDPQNVILDQQEEIVLVPHVSQSKPCDA